MFLVPRSLRPSRLLLGAVGILFSFLGPDPSRAQDSGAQGAPDFERDARPLLARHCFACHGNSKKPKGNLNLEAAAGKDSAPAARKAWKKAWDQLQSREMPPEDKPQPAAAERERMVRGIEALLALPSKDGRRETGRAIVRRLSRKEYNNTICDLFALQRENYIARILTYENPEKVGQPGPLLKLDPEKGLPDGLGLNLRPRVLVDLPYDDVEGFDTQADALTLPPYLLERYAEAARLAVEEMAQSRGKASSQTRRSMLPVLPGPAKSARDAARESLAMFASRAFRRPVDEPEIDRLLRLFDEADRNGEDFEKAMRVPLRAILVSPRFLLRLEGLDDSPADGTPRAVTDFELASRLSYFLWSTMPDAELFRLAGERRLHDPVVLEAQVRRMWRDIRTTEFAENFTTQWLKIDRLEGVMRDPDRFPIFKGEAGHDLLGQMSHEVILLFLRILVENRSILEFLDADYAYVSRPLAHHYGLDDRCHPKQGYGDYRRVPLGDKRRGGVLTTAAVLTATSSPTRTSPVKRGKWVLEALLGSPPPPPLDNVAVISDAPPAADRLTIRGRLERHRADPTCASCHNRIDPIGIGLENYDALGAWREKEGPLPIDAKAAFPDGLSFSGPVELKALLLTERRDQFVRALIEHLLVYALGRKLEYYDLRAISEIRAKVAADGYRFQTLILEIVRSYPFLHRRSGGAKDD